MSVRQRPSWLRGVGAFSQWPQQARAHGPFGKPVLTARQRREVHCIPLMLKVQHASAIDQAHALGARALSYLSFYDTYGSSHIDCTTMKG